MPISRQLALPLALLVLWGCGGDDASDETPLVFVIEATPYQVDATEEELDLGDADAVLAAALSAIQVSSAVLVGNLGNLDHGSAPPGRGDIQCSVGFVRETVAESSGERHVALQATQCFDPRSDGVQDGLVTLSYGHSTPGEAAGVLEFGSETSSFLSGFPEIDDLDYSFRQARGRVAFHGDFDGSLGTSTASGLSIVFGKGPRPSVAGGVFAPTRSIEVLTGTAGLELSVTGSSGGGSTNLDLSGRLSVSGTGSALNPACAFDASFDAATNRTVQIASTDKIVRAGLLTVSTSSGSATVEFDASGNASVDLGAGTPQAYPVAIVRNFCVF